MFILPVTLLASFLLIGSEQGTCPPVVVNGKLHGILPVVNQKVIYSEVVDCGSVSQLDVFRRARLWITQSDHTQNEAAALSDKDTGDLAGHFSQTIMIPRSENSAGGVYIFRYAYAIECANRKYRITLSQIRLDEGNGRYIPIEVYCQKTDKELQVIYLELDKQLTSVLAAVQESVRNYKAF
ncbi:DUF4468 domain-containing protein [Spirosoma koreense]